MIDVAWRLSDILRASSLDEQRRLLAKALGDAWIDGLHEGEAREAAFATDEDRTPNFNPYRKRA